MHKHFRTRDLKVVPIGNSRGVRLPKSVLDKYAFVDIVVLEERDDGILLRSRKGKKLSWEDTYKAMAREREDWADLGDTLGDGLSSKDNQW